MTRVTVRTRNPSVQTENPGSSVSAATQSEVNAGTETAKYVSPATLQGRVDTDGTLAANSDVKIPSQKAVKTYVDANGGGGVSTITEKKQYYRGEFRINRLINTSTGATSSNTTYDTTDYIEIEPGTEITIRLNTGGSFTCYGWTYTSALIAISEIRSNSLIGTSVTTYSFTTPANAKYIQIYCRYGGTGSISSVGFRPNLVIERSSESTHNAIIKPEDYSGTDLSKIQQAIDAARWTSAIVELNDYYEISGAIIVYSGTRLKINGRVKAAVGFRDNFIRNEAVADPINIFTRGNKYIEIFGSGSIEGSDENWGSDNPADVGTYRWKSIGIFLANVEFFKIDGLRLVSTPSWGISVEQCRYGLITNLTYNQDGRQNNQDGINIRRGSHHISVRNIYGTTYDDVVAMTNLELSPTINILGSTIYEPYSTELTIHNIVVENIHTLVEYKFSLSPPLYGGGVLVLCEDGLKCRDISIRNITNEYAHVYIGFHTYQYWVTTQCALGDMTNINVTDCNSAVYIRRPISGCSFINCKTFDQTVINKSVAIPLTSTNVLRKYPDNNFEYFTSVDTLDPTTISNCLMWFDAADSSSLTYDGSNNISQWNDKSGNALHVTASGSNRPTYLPLGAIMRKGGVQFNGTSHALRRAKIANMQSQSGLTVFMVGGNQGSQKGGGLLFHGYDTTNRTVVTNNYEVDTLSYGILSAGTSAQGTFSLGQLTLQRTDIVFDGSLSGNSNRLKMWVNGLQRTLTFTGTIPATTESHASSVFALGVLDFSSPVYIAGTACEIIVYNRALTSNEVSQVQAYLSAKWAC
jgi:hypothetical protein